MDCIFCKITNGEISAKIIAQSQKSMAFLDAFPLTEGHCLVIPKKHYQKIQEMEKEENSDLFELVRKVLKKLDTISEATLVAVHNGKESGQEIPHVHVHLIPRKKDDGAGPVHSMFKERPQLSDDKTTQLQNKLKI